MQLCRRPSTAVRDAEVRSNARVKLAHDDFNPIIAPKDPGQKVVVHAIQA
jgi:hypothetical protein